jgi:hypothetical protein
MDREMMKRIVLVFALLFPAGAQAQSTATPVLPGLLVSVGCPAGYTYCYVPYSNTNPLPVSGTITPSGTQDTNLKQVNGAAVNVGIGAAGTGTQRVTTSTDSTIGTVTAVTAITNALPAGTNVLGHVITDSGSVTAASGTVASGASDSGNPVKTGGVYNSSPITVTTGQRADTQVDSHGSSKQLQVDSTGAAIDYTTNLNFSPYPGGSTNVSCATGNVAASTATCTMPATTGKFTYVTGFDITGSGATLGSAVTCTLTNTDSGTHSYTFVAIAGALLADNPLVRSFSPPLKATASNTAPVLSCPSLGAGNTNTTINMYGYEL